MKKRIGRRLLSLLLTVVTVLTLLPAMTLPARAATLSGLDDKSIGLSFEGDKDATWTADGKLVSGSVKSYKFLFSQYDYHSTLTITNTKNTKATLSFNYTAVLNNGTIRVDSEPVRRDGKDSFYKELAAGGTITVYIESGSTSATNITMTDISLVADATPTVTFLPAVNGSYTVDGKSFTKEFSKTQSSMTPYQVEATPAEGYEFLGWYNVTEKKYIHTSRKAALNIENDCTITARFASKTAALFETGGQRFDDLNEAITEAQKMLPATIALVSSGTITRSYTIPADITLLIPFDEAKTLYKETPTAIRETPETKAFRTLTMTAGSSITLERGAAISVGGQSFAPAGSEKGRMVGPYGCIKMESGSAITVQNGASLYAWGFISGSGSVTVQSGGSVYEWYQIMDFRGGSASTNMGNKVFPFNQYAVQNIEVPLTVYAGASETTFSAVYAMGGIKSTSVSFIGRNGLFNLTSGSLTKAYDGNTDRMIYTIDGSAELNHLKLNLFLKFNIDSSRYVLPLTNNMTVNLSQGSKLTLNQSVALLPGVEVTIAKGAELIVPSGKSMFIYDVDEWGSYCGGGENNSTFIPVVYRPGRTASARLLRMRK